MTNINKKGNELSMDNQPFDGQEAVNEQEKLKAVKDETKNSSNSLVLEEVPESEDPKVQIKPEIDADPLHVVISGCDQSLKESGITPAVTGDPVDLSDGAILKHLENNTRQGAAQETKQENKVPANSPPIKKRSEKKGKPETNVYVETFQFIFKSYMIRRNSYTGVLEAIDIKSQNKEMVTDRFVNGIVLAANEGSIKSNKTIVWTVLDTSNHTQEYNPLHDYLNRLPIWDGSTDFIGLIAERVQVAGTPQWKEWFKRWFVAMVASGLKDDVHNEMMLILYGKQSVGKTTFLRNLIPASLTKYYYTGIVNPSNEEFFGHLSKFILINIDELVGMTKKSFKELKEFLSKKTVHHRIKYDKYGQDFPRRASFAGTTNEKEFLFDLSGNRRFICAEAISIDYQSPMNLDMAYAQAYSLVNAGEFKYWFTEEDVAELEANNRQFHNVSPEEEKIHDYFMVCDKGEEDFILTATDIADIIFKMNGRPISSDTTRKIGSIMIKNGFIKKKKPNGNQGYAVKMASIDRFMEVQHLVSDY